MPSAVAVYVCKDREEAQKAETRLLVEFHYPPTGINTYEDVPQFNYDAKTFGAGTKDGDTFLGKYVVVGVK
jgi:hypothetical protein